MKNNIEICTILFNCFMTNIAFMILIADEDARALKVLRHIKLFLLCAFL